MTLDELDLEDEILDNNNPQQVENEPEDLDKPWIDPTGTPQDPEPPQESEDDILTAFLKSKGINPDAIKMENENGEVEEFRFNDLSRDEQLQIINYNPKEYNYDLDAEETEFLNMLRQNNLSVRDYLNYYGNQAVQNYLGGLEDNTVYNVDSWSDDELFIADLKEKVPDLTDEEVLQQLELEKQNEALFNKKMSGLRSSYKQKEEMMLQQETAEKQKEEEERAAAFENLIVQTIQENGTIDFGDSQLSLSEDDMNEVASFILDSDAAGVRHLAKALNDPKTLVDMAWFALKGREALAAISKYYKQKITEVGKSNYDKGYSDATAGRTASKTIVKKSQPSRQTNFKSIDDLD